MMQRLLPRGPRVPRPRQHHSHSAFSPQCRPEQGDSATQLPSSFTQLLHHSQGGSIAPAVFFSDLEFKRTTDLGVAATGLQGTAYLSLLGPGML